MRHVEHLHVNSSLHCLQVLTFNPSLPLPQADARTPLLKVQIQNLEHADYEHKPPSLFERLRFAQIARWRLRLRRAARLRPFHIWG